MDIVTSVLTRRDSLPAGTRIDSLLLSSDQRASAHLTAVSENGCKVRISLPRGTSLQDGDVLHLEKDQAIVVKAAEEPLFRLRPGKDAAIWAMSVWQLGNLHRPVRFTAEGLLTPRDPMVAGFLTALGQGWEEVVCAFEGLRVSGDQAFRHHAAHDPHDHGHNNAQRHQEHSHGHVPTHDRSHAHDHHQTHSHPDHHHPHS